MHNALCSDLSSINILVKKVEEIQKLIETVIKLAKGTKVWCTEVLPTVCS